MPDVAYALTRRRGRPTTIVRVLDHTSHPETGARELITQLHNLRHVVQEPTSYGRLMKASATQQDVGSTTFLVWTGDTALRRLDVEDYLIRDGQKFQVVTSEVEETALIITAKAVRGAVGKQTHYVNAGNNLGMGGSASYEVS